MTTATTAVGDHGGETVARLLIVDDDERLALALRGALRRRGYEVAHVTTAASALASRHYDLVLLDLGLPDADGLDVCRQLRTSRDIGIIIITGRAKSQDRVLGLAAGADDYVVKPFGLLELIARLQAVLRRYRPERGLLVAGPLLVNLDGHEVLVDGRPVELTRKEFQILALLAGTPGAVVHRQRMVTEVWQTSWLGKSRTVDVHIATMRAKLGPAVTIENVRGVGYRLAPPAPTNGNLHAC